MKVYVSQESLRQSIEYFRDKSYESPEQIGLFLLFKAAAMNSRTYVKFKGIDSEDKKKLLGYLYNLTAVFNLENETGGKRTGLFPFSIVPSIKSSSFYNGGTIFSGLFNRISDTIDNTLTDDNKYMRKDETNPGFYRFAPNYITMLFNDFLKGDKISLGRLATWYFRFYEINVPDEWSSRPEDHIEDFTRLCTKKILDDLNITPDEKATLFDDDDFQIDFQSNVILGSTLRGMLSFENGAEPEVTTSPMTSLPADITIIAVDEVNDLLTPHGNNITAEKLKELLFSVKQVILAGPPGTGKTYISDQIKQHFKDTHLVQFHPNLTYEQFIGGHIFDKTGNVYPKAGVFVEFCQQAQSDPTEKYLFLIDEINRANVSKVFGEVILTLDREYTTQLPISLTLINGSEISDFCIPDNVYIIATMNSADRSIALVDYAIRRRFGYVNFYPNCEIIDFMSDYSNVDLNVSKLMEKLNEKILAVLGDADLLLGQSYFIPKWALNAGKIQWTNDILKSLFNYYILPIVEEYTYGNRRYLLNIMGDNLILRIDDTTEFIKEIKKQFSV